ncbi:RNA 2',3'-cyclic phosphodiesterase [Persephonella sp.]|uniref:RNA 2',3'-cyclic phosphodiesterase n=1 Tax=Persephonella sp. TaxID=2060922 RepID=UPI0025F02D57|nr:RNA 2',3'-cyclic phosphodiesterase [Persephonella sp.]
MKKRVFIGSFVKIPGFSKEYPKIKKEFGGILAGRWIPERNFHITYRFLGDISIYEINNIKAILKDKLEGSISVSIKFKGLGAFPNLANPRVFFIQVEDTSGNLQEISRFINQKLALLGYPEEKKLFKPHITLKRIKQVDNEQFLRKIKSYENKLFGVQKEIKINIVESILRPEGAIYKPVE